MHRACMIPNQPLMLRESQLLTHEVLVIVKTRSLCELVVASSKSLAASLLVCTNINIDVREFIVSIGCVLRAMISLQMV